MVQIIKHKKLWYIISGALFIGAILSIIFFGIRFGIDYTGGSMLRIKFANEIPSNDKILASLKDFDLGEIIIQPSEESASVMIKFKDIDEPTHQNILSKIKKDFATQNPEEEKFDSIGPVIGKELKQKSFWASILVLIMISVYIAIAFRKVSKPVSSTKYGIATLIALFHDVIIMVGVFAFLGYYLKIEVGLPFIAAVLTILGHSVMDTVVVFDRTRENLTRFLYGSGAKENFDELVNRSLNQTMARSINTTFSTLLPLIAIYIIGGNSIKYFALALIIGFICGAYSSIFIASPLLVSFNEAQIKGQNK